MVEDTIGTSSDAATKVSFSHVHLYVDQIQDLSVYKALEERLTAFAGKLLDEDDNNNHNLQQRSTTTLADKKALWKSLAAVTTRDEDNDVPFAPHNRDVVQQLLAGLGFRITAARYPTDAASTIATSTTSTTNTRTVLVTSCDPRGVQILVTAVDPKSSDNNGKDAFGHFDAARVHRFLQAHDSRQGIACLAFHVENVKQVYERYQKLHPALIADYQEYPGDAGADSRTVKVLEVFAYYQEHADVSSDADASSSAAPTTNNENGAETKRSADTGTVLRFLETPTDSVASDDGTCPLPGLTPVGAVFASGASSSPVYCDHWVSNVFSRTEFLDTLQDTLGFTPKVDFNAGVVAAGEAQIESTVTGNDSASNLDDKKQALRDQSQVYLPINNALSSVGHVHGFLKELGQGVQHVASRVENLVDFVQRGNDNREMTGEGFIFLRIPRSYYGILSLEQLTNGIVGDASDSVSETCARDMMRVLVSTKVLTKDGAVSLDTAEAELDALLENGLDGASLKEYQGRSKGVLGVILRSRYTNLYSLLRHHVSEDTYLGIVRNQILVDIQGEDLLYQIFTAQILQRQPGEEAPFFEFIQRVCSECIDAQGCQQKVRPGCGGFGIRNFLTLFLSIEVSKAMQEVLDAEAEDDEERRVYAETMVDYFTKQLNEANPILTSISNAMTEEGNCKEELANCIAKKDVEEAAQWEVKMSMAAERKQQGNQKLLECSARYNSLMKGIRETRQAAARK